MTDLEGTYGWDEVHALSGAYAVDALDDDERARFEAHLLRCPDCRAEVDSLREAAGTLALDPAEPSADLRDRVLDGIESIRPLPPLTDTGRPDVVQLATRRRARTAPTALLVAAALALVAAVGGTLWLHPWSGDRPTEPITATERVLDADDAARFTQRFDDGSRATVVVSRSEGRAVILTEDMALAPSGKVYELWLQTPKGTMEPAGLMPDDGDATVLLDGDAAHATGVGITVEPDGGSEQPTSDPIAFFDLAT
jgi:anti-sigma-K factor RskA